MSESQSSSVLLNRGDMQNIKKVIENLQNITQGLEGDIENAVDLEELKSNALDQLKQIVDEAGNGIKILGGESQEDHDDDILEGHNQLEQEQDGDQQIKDKDQIIKELESHIRDIYTEYEYLLKEKEQEIEDLRYGGNRSVIDDNSRQDDHNPSFVQNIDNSVDDRDSSNQEGKKVNFRHKKISDNNGIDRKSQKIRTQDPKVVTDHKYKPQFYKNHPHSVYHLKCCPVIKRPASYYKEQAIKNKTRQTKGYEEGHVDLTWWKPARNLPQLDPDLQIILNALPLLKPYQTITRTWELNVLNSPILGPYRDKFKRGYEGQYLKNKFHGWGVFVRDQGRFYYEGEFYNGKEDGWGRQLASNGEVLEGEWKEGQFRGVRNQFDFETKQIL